MGPEDPARPFASPTPFTPGDEALGLLRGVWGREPGSPGLTMDSEGCVQARRAQGQGEGLAPLQTPLSDRSPGP